MSRRHSRDEPTSLAGWLYADMFLALVVVGLASVWVTGATAAPDDDEIRVTTTTTTTTTTTVAPRAGAGSTTTTSTTIAPLDQFQLSCTEFATRNFTASQLRSDPDAVRAAIEDDFDQELRSRGLDRASAKPGLVLLNGSYTRGSEGQGKVDANTYRSQLREAVPLLTDVEIRTSSANNPEVGGEPQKLPAERGHFNLVIYLVYQGDPSASGCDE